jgi:hypothetical protein
MPINVLYHTLKLAKGRVITDAAVSLDEIEHIEI